MSKLLESWFHDAVSALAYSLAERHAAAGDPVLASPHNDLTQFILRQHERMADYLLWPMLAATLGFDLIGLVRGKRFHSQSPEQRRRQIASWKVGKLRPQRDLIRFHESLATLALYDRLTTHVPTPDGRARLSQRAVESQPGGGALGQTRPTTAASQELRCEIAVVGSGPGGAITACLLAEAGRDVLLVEEGPFLPLDSCPAFSRLEMEQKYRNGGLTVALGANKIAYVEGRCVGGGSEINSGLYHRTPPEVLARWRREFLVEALTEKDLLPHFEANEGDLSVSKLPGPAPAASLKLHEGATKLGWHSLEVPRWFRHDADGGGQRQSMTETFVPRFLQAGGKLLADTRVVRLRSGGKRWTLEAARSDGGTVRILADSVFVCAGAVQTPALLRRSGITCTIGDSLRVHPTLKLVAEFPEAVNSATMGVPVHQVKEFAPRLSFGCSISSPAYLALGLLDHPDQAATVSRDWRRMANYYAMITGEGHGTVRTLPGFHDPRVCYAISEKDRRDLADGWRKLAEALFAAGAEAIFPCVTGSAVLRSAAALQRLPDALASGTGNLMTIHLFCSCPMGEDRKRCATDSFGRVHGLPNLRINDASLLCTAPGVNPQGTIMVLARRNALQFLGKP
jgi:choline dehydrogenase-like flavoprotein